ncbi:SLATT domain-containing protein [Streptomyces aculeolatus]
MDDRRKLYREEVTTAIEQCQAESRKYRRIRNGLQTLIMIGSASTNTIAALDTGKELTRQSVALTGISFAITVVAMFTGYYKFRERSYFLQQTADAIEEEINAVRLGIGPYREYGSGQEDEALKKFTQRVEDHRNEQRRR